MMWLVVIEQTYYPIVKHFDTEAEATIFMNEVITQANTTRNAYGLSEKFHKVRISVSHVTAEQVYEEF